MKRYRVTFRIVETVEIEVAVEDADDVYSAAQDELERQQEDGSYTPLDSETILESVHEVK